ncbi:MAG TPA: hypothetical protein DCQ26_19205 [Marinilabiliales bacterium]|nr:MAG: hypothetical protein A2W95_11505 [Bacteroidetes bacterium GWA2_40_14]OFX61721.1 MAG: hypothetical protein A2W84_13540 [Bacteroidetes bacterium GWC2_40_13]OFX72494.1 MAG: hypothetical protein A2W96_05500 [Bacteroidetes bacterium GWD2_40_43]OFX90578.1 MAG: hypothetical protein A2W97_02270 [Bacteroidetes bacterium GWE2_40_63]OFY20944.1 MAG: hypothetical protein A2W88_17990 [Bacteroidetes bacterium GWF2_40_13]OFZ26463.1 MAG: hypothetical protein A2437_07135 [Bacteroidetes bacterium RIFOXYC
MDSKETLQFILRAQDLQTPELDLSNKGITEIPAEIGQLVHLKILNLSYNQISELPPALCNLINLEKLYITRNQISRLPVGMGNFVNLKSLDLSYNPLGKLPSELGLLCQLEWLDASFCELKSLPVELINLYNLREFNLEENPLIFPAPKVVKRGLYAVMYFLTLEKRKREAAKVLLHVFNMPEPIQGSFRQYIRYFNQVVSQANNKEVVFDVNFINQDLHPEMHLNAGVEGYLYEVMRFIQEKLDVLKNSQHAIQPISTYYADSRLSEIKERLFRFNESLDDKIEEIRQMKREIKGLYDSMEI